MRFIFHLSVLIISFYLFLGCNKPAPIPPCGIACEYNGQYHGRDKEIRTYQETPTVQRKTETQPYNASIDIARTVGNTVMIIVRLCKEDDNDELILNLEGEVTGQDIIIVDETFINYPNDEDITKISQGKITRMMTGIMFEFREERILDNYTPTDDHMQYSAKHEITTNRVNTSEYNCN